jgi:hypothetical protein
MRTGRCHPRGAGDPNMVEEVENAFPDGPLAQIGMPVQDVSYLIADREHGIERTQRLLENHRDITASIGIGAQPRRRNDVVASKADRPPGKPDRRREKAHDGLRRQRLAAAALADQADHFALSHRQIDAVDSDDPALRRSDVDVKVAYVEQRLTGSGGTGRLHCANRLLGSGGIGR